MRKHLVFKDIKSLKVGHSRTAIIPFFVLEDYDPNDENTKEALKKLRYISCLQYFKVKRARRDVFRIEPMEDYDLDPEKIKKALEKGYKIKKGTINDLVDFYVRELGYADYDDLVYHMELQKHNKKNV